MKKISIADIVVIFLLLVFAGCKNDDDNDNTTLIISIGSPVNATEGMSNASFTVSLDDGAINDTGSSITGTITLTGTATSGTDYTNVTSFSIADGDNSVLVTVPVIDDNEAENTETITATLSAPSVGIISNNNAVTVNINDDDTAGGDKILVGFLDNEVAVAEKISGNATAELTLTFSKKPKETMLVIVSVSETNARNTIDYTIDGLDNGLLGVEVSPDQDQAIIPVQILSDFTVDESHSLTFKVLSITGSPEDTIELSDNLEARLIIEDNTLNHGLLLRLDGNTIKDQSSFDHEITKSAGGRLHDFPLLDITEGYFFNPDLDENDGNSMSVKSTDFHSFDNNKDFTISVIANILDIDREDNRKYMSILEKWDVQTVNNDAFPFAIRCYKKSDANDLEGLSQKIAFERSFSEDCPTEIIRLLSLEKVQEGTPLHIIVQKKGTISSLFINGVLQGSVEDVVGESCQVQNEIEINFGLLRGLEVSRNYYSGSLDDIMIYDRALSDIELEVLQELRL